MPRIAAVAPGLAPSAPAAVVAGVAKVGAERVRQAETGEGLPPAPVRGGARDTVRAPGRATAP